MANNGKLRSPVLIFILYIAVSGLIIFLFRFIYPGSDTPLWIYSRTWRFLKGFLEVFDWYPALAFSALVIPFGFVSDEENFQSFTDIFLKRLINSVLIAVCAAVIYGLIFFLVFPILKNKEENLLYKGEIYKHAKTLAQERRNSGDWHEASQFLAVCDNIWPANIELNELRAEVEINLSRQRSKDTFEKERARTELLRNWRNTDVSTFSGNRLVDADQAVSMSNEAFNEQRYFDAHWLATLAGRLAIAGSPEVSNAARIASASWNMIASQEPSQMERHQYDIFHLKLSGYQAMNTGDWIRAFYIFQELLSITPDDPDASNFYAASERGAIEYAFFLEEMEFSIGKILTGALFSLPAENNGRAVARFSSLTTSKDVAYGMGFEYMAFDEDAHLFASAVSRYAKILPFALNNNQQILILTHALDRNNEENYFDSDWLLGNKTPGGIILNISYDDLLLLSYVRYGLPNLQINELFLASGRLNDKGYVSQIFQAEILNRLGSVLFFLPIAIITITMGWCYRVKTKPRYFFVLMLPIFPVVFHGFVFMYRSVINTLGIWLVLSFGFVPALVAFIVFLAVFLFVSLITLAAQHL
jgi:hypothetical protein